MMIDSEDLIKRLPAMIQSNRLFEPGKYHIGPKEEWCMFFPEVVEAIRTYCRCIETEKYTLSAPVEGDWGKTVINGDVAHYVEHADVVNIE